MNSLLSIAVRQRGIRDQIHHHQPPTDKNKNEKEAVVAVPGDATRLPFSTSWTNSAVC